MVLMHLICHLEELYGGRVVVSPFVFLDYSADHKTRMRLRMSRRVWCTVCIFQEETCLHISFLL